MSQKKHHVMRVPIDLWERIVTHPLRNEYQTPHNFAVGMLSNAINANAPVTSSHTKTVASPPSSKVGQPSAATGEEKTQKRYNKIYSVSNKSFIYERESEEEYNIEKRKWDVFLQKFSSDTLKYGEEFEKLNWAYQVLFVDDTAEENVGDMPDAIKYAERYMKDRYLEG